MNYKSVPLEKMNGAAKNYLLGWVQMALNNRTICPSVWEEGIRESIRFGKMMDGKEDNDGRETFTRTTDRR